MGANMFSNFFLSELFYQIPWVAFAVIGLLTVALPALHLLLALGRSLTGRDPATVVHQCGSGVTACHNLLAMEHAGLAGSRLYPGSWSEWCADPARPVARG